MAPRTSLERLLPNKDSNAKPGSLATSCNPSSGTALCGWNTVKAGLVATPVLDKGDRLIAGFDLTYHQATFGQAWPEGERSRRKQDQHHLHAQGRGFEPRSGRNFFAFFSLRNQR